MTTPDATASTVPLELAERFFAAIEAGDLATVEQLYDPAVEVWHNTDRVVQGRADNLRTLAWVIRSLPDLRYTDIRREPTPNGFVQQHVLVATSRSGEPVEVPACIVVTVTEGRITRLDEYLDSADVARLSAT